MGGMSNAAGNVRLFMAPGMGHCGGGDGPTVFDRVGSLDQWVEKGQAPQSLIASHSKDGKVDRTRPLCPYPRVAMYKGSSFRAEGVTGNCGDQPNWRDHPDAMLTAVRDVEIALAIKGQHPRDIQPSRFRGLAVSDINSAARSCKARR